MFKILHARVTEVTRKIITMEESIKHILSGDDIIDDVPKKEFVSILEFSTPKDFSVKG